MNDTSNNSLDLIDSLLQNEELKEEAKAILLLNVVSILVSYSQEKAKYYWEKLKKIKKSIIKDEKGNYVLLSTLLDYKIKSKFVADILAKIDQALKLSSLDVEKAINLLYDCENRLKKRIWPIGKSHLWSSLIIAWFNIDRKKGLNLINKIRKDIRLFLICQLN